MNARVLIQDAEYDDSLKPVIAGILEEFPRDWKNKTVLVKPNILAPTPPEKAVTTHPSIVIEVVRQLTEKGAKVMVGDNSGVRGYGKLEEAAKTAGIFDAADGHFVHLGGSPVCHSMNSKYFDRLMISKEVLEADVVVNLPKLKTHGLTRMTLSIKNTFGYLVGGEKMRVHASAPNPRSFAEALVDIFQIRPPELNIMDAVMAHEGNGPSNGSPRKVGKILASDNAVSLDAVALHLVGQTLSSVPMVEIAAERGLGEADLSRISMNQEIIPIKDFKMPSSFLPGLMGVVLNRFMSQSIASTPVVIEKKCKACQICVNHCPVEAMQMNGEFPRVDVKRCIKCYCCQEMCPSDAIEFSGVVATWSRKIVGSLDKLTGRES